METKANHVLIGAFLLLALAGGFGFVTWMNERGVGAGSRIFAIRFAGPVRGLTPAADVLFNGVKAGKVLSVGIAPEDARKVAVTITLDGKMPVRANSRASVVRIGLTGLAAVEISPGSPDQPLVADGGDHGAPPTIAAEPPVTASSLMEAAPEILGKVDLAITRLNDLIARNEDAVDATLRHAAAFSGTLSERRDDVGRIIANVAELSDQLQRVSGKLETALDRVNGMLGDNSATTLAADVRETVAAFRSLAVKLETGVVGDDGLTETAKRSLRELERFLRDGRKAAASLDRTLDTIDRNPQSLLFGVKQVPEYTPQ